MMRRPPRSTQGRSSAASDVYKRQGVDKVLAFYRHWHAARQFPRAFMFVRYEAMHADPAGILGRVLQFIGTPDVPAATTAAAADFARFENLRDAEARNLFDNPMLATRPNADPEAFQAVSYTHLTLPTISPV